MGKDCPLHIQVVEFTRTPQVFTTVGRVKYVWSSLAFCSQYLLLKKIMKPSPDSNEGFNSVTNMRAYQAAK